MQHITLIKISTLFLAMALSCFEASAIKSSTITHVPDCKNSRVPSEQEIQINNNGNLYNFKFALVCGHVSSQTYYPTAYVVQELINDFYKNGTISLTVTQDPPSNPLAKDRFLLEVEQSLFNDHFAFNEEVQLTYERNYIHMVNQSHIIPGKVRTAEEPFKGLRDIQWRNDCSQESAGWCYTWDGYFAITWEWDGHNDVEEMKKYVIRNILPQVFQESYIKYEKFVSKSANS